MGKWNKRGGDVLVMCNICDSVVFFESDFITRSSNLSLSLFLFPSLFEGTIEKEQNGEIFDVHRLSNESLHPVPSHSILLFDN